jgi:hypothetical protein
MKVHSGKNTTPDDNPGDDLHDGAPQFRALRRTSAATAISAQ